MLSCLWGHYFCGRGFLNNPTVDVGIVFVVGVGFCYGFDSVAIILIVNS